jgi:uncharacterized protein YndB with AHSA1/START domain
MPKNKDLKRLVRTRMQKTGESYTTARAQLLKKSRSQQTTTKAPRPASRTARAAAKLQSVATKSETTPIKVSPAREYAAIAGMSDAAVQARTGRAWAEWVEVLDAIDATKLSHGEITKHLNEKLGVDGWWAQMVTVGYERIRGLRDKGQRRGGGYEINKSKTYPVPVRRMFEAVSTPRGRKAWLPERGITVRKTTPDKTIRMTWSNGTSVEFYFIDKGAAKSQVALQHRKLASKAEAEKMRKYWGERLDALAATLGSAKSRS